MSKRGPRKVLVVAQREYLATVRTRAFLLAIILLPVLGCAAVLLPLLAESQTGTESRVFTLVDETGVVGPALRRALSTPPVEPEGWGQAFVNSPSHSGNFTMNVVSPDIPRDNWLLTLSEQVRNGRSFAFVVAESGLVEGSEDAKLRYFSNTPTATALKNWVRQEVGSAIQAERLRRLGIDPQQVAQTRDAIALVEEPLYVERQGRIEKDKVPDPLRDIGFPIVAVMVMFTAAMMGVGPLMQSTLEEKMYRIAEVLVSSVPPFQMMLGKLLGAVAVSFTLLFTYLLGALLIASTLSNASELPWYLLIVVPPFLALSVLIYGAIFLAVGAACSDLKETQSLTMPLMLILTAPLLLLRFVLADPNGTTSIIASLIPFFTPLLMLLRTLLSPPPPAWQVVLGFVLALTTGLGCLVAAGRIFRVGMLTQGSRPSYRQLWQWIRSP